MYGIGYEKSDVKTKRINSGFKALTSDSHFPKLQENFEHNLGKYAYKNKNAISAVDKGLAKMRKVLVTYYKDKYSNIKDQAEREAQICLDAFTNTDDPTSAGQVGKIKYKQLCEIIESNIPQGDKEINSQIDKQTGMAGASNLREKMTAFYNAAYYKGYKDKNPEENITNFKNIAQKIAVGGQSELVDELDLDSSILEEQKNTSTNPRKAGIVRALYNAGAGHKVIGFFGKIARIFNKDFDKDKQFSNRMHTRDVYDMALISLGQKSMGAKLDNVRSGSNLRYRGEEEQKEVQRSLDYYNNMGLDLSERERNYILETVSAQYLTSHPVPEKSKDETIETFNQRIKDHAVKYSVYMDKVRKKIDPSYTPEESLEKKLYQKFADDPSLNEEVEKTKSPIKEGIVYKDIPKKGGFLKDIMVDKHNVRIVNGISMTTARMLKTYKWLNLKSDLKNFRLALMGWMLPTDDHSLWEIIIGSHNVGVKGKEDLTDIVSLDQTVDPLSTNILRYNVCEEVDGSPKFPHEIVYWNQRHGKDESYEKTVSLGGEKKKIYETINKNQTSLFQGDEEFKDAQNFSTELKEREMGNEKEITELEKKKGEINKSYINFDNINDAGLCIDEDSATGIEIAQLTSEKKVELMKNLKEEEKGKLKDLENEIKSIENAVKEKNFELVVKNIKNLQTNIGKKYLVKSRGAKNNSAKNNLAKLQKDVKYYENNRKTIIENMKKKVKALASSKKAGYENLDINNEEMIKERAEQEYEKEFQKMNAKLKKEEAPKEKESKEKEDGHYSRSYYFLVEAALKEISDSVDTALKSEEETLEKKIRELNEKSDEDDKLKSKYSDPVQKAAILTYTSEIYLGINQITQLSSMGRLSKAFTGKYVSEAILDEYFKAVKGSQDPFGHSNDERIKNKKQIDKIKSTYKEKKRSGNTSTTDNESGEVLTSRTIKEQYKSDLKAEKDRYKEYLKKREEAEKSEHFEKYKNDLLAESNMLCDSLRSVPKKFTGNVYSGTWAWPGRYKKGKVTTFSMFTSTSKELPVAKSFIGGPGGLTGAKKLIGKNVLLNIKLNGKGGVDLTAVTQYERKKKDIVDRLESGKDTRKQALEKELAELNKLKDKSLTEAFSMSTHGDAEAEVLCLPGTKIRVEKITDNVNLSQYKGGPAPDTNERQKNTSEEIENKEGKSDKFGLLVECKEI